MYSFNSLNNSDKVRFLTERGVFLKYIDVGDYRYNFYHTGSFYVKYSYHRENFKTMENYCL